MLMLKPDDDKYGGGADDNGDGNDANGDNGNDALLGGCKQRQSAPMTANVITVSNAKMPP